MVGTCRHFALLSCALLRYRGIAARVRCGFATYFQPGQGLDHWVTEYQDRDGRWVRIDTEILGGTVLDHPADLRPGEFLSGGEMLPWDEWGRMTAAYRGETGEDYDELLDELAAVCAADDPAAVADLYAHDDLKVPAGLIG